MITDPIECSVKDPILVDGIRDTYFCHFLSIVGYTQLEHLSLRRDLYHTVRYLDTLDDNNILFSIVKGYKNSRLHYNCCDPRIRHVSRERFVDMVSRDFPDHFDWLLFHPEWL